jgi:hypothetical protein
MHKTRLLLLLLVLTLTVLSFFAAPPVSQAYDYCSQFNNEDCVYNHYNAETGCCTGIKNHPGPVICPDICF